MATEIPFNNVMKDPDNWTDMMDLDVMTDNYLKLKPIMNKLFFEEYPAHPELFVALFSKSDFVDRLIDVAKMTRISELDKIYFKEYTEEDKKRLVEMGVLDPLPVQLDLNPIVYTNSGNCIFINVFA